MFLAVQAFYSCGVLNTPRCFKLCCESASSVGISGMFTLFSREQRLLQEYDIETAEDIQDALRDLLGGTIKEMMEVCS